MPPSIECQWMSYRNTDSMHLFAYYVSSLTVGLFVSNIKTHVERNRSCQFHSHVFCIILIRVYVCVQFHKILNQSFVNYWLH